MGTASGFSSKGQWLPHPGRALPYPAEYIRIVGGSTWHWAAQAWRVLPNDMKIKSLYGVGRDWPISYDELEPYYHEAEVKTGVSGAPNTGSPRAPPVPP